MHNEDFSDILAAILDVGEIMLTSGAEVNRVENTMERMAKAYGCTRVDSYTIILSIVVTVKAPDGQVLTQTRRTTFQQTDMRKIEACNALSRKVCSQPVSLSELEETIKGIKELKEYPIWAMFAIYGFISAVFSAFFGGSIMDVVAAGLCGLILYASVYVSGRLRLQRIILNILCSMMVALGAVGLTRLGIGDSVDKIIIGNIMLLIPGIAFTTSLRDMINGDLISGLLGLCEAVIRALAIAAGFALVLWGVPW